MARSNREGAAHIYRVAERFKQAALLSVDSLLTPGRPIWTTEHLDELNQRFVLQPDTSNASFDQKLAGQLAGATDGAVQLMSEILLMHLLINRRISGRRKRDLLRTILNRGVGTKDIQLPPDVDEALDYGICWPGTFFNTGRDRHIRFLIDWMRDWRQLSPEQVASALEGPWAFKEQLSQVEVGSAALQRTAVLHLLFPDYFERIMKQEHKVAVVAAFADRIGGRDRAEAMDEDQALLAIRQELAKEYGQDFDFYDTPEVESVWRPPGAAPPAPLLDRIMAHYPGWTGFSDPRYLAEEREYKVKASELAIALLGREALQSLISEGRQHELVERIERIARATNLLWVNVPRDGDLSALYRQGLHVPSFTEALFDLLHGDGDSPDRLDRFVGHLTNQNLPTKWAFPTYLLMLLNPETDFFVKPEMTRWLLRQLSPNTGLPYKPAGDAYRGVLGAVSDLREALVAYEPSDLLDIQSYVWVAYHKPSSKLLGKPFNQVFPDWDTAWWALDTVRWGLGRLGVSTAGDARIAVSLTAGAIHVSFASWLTFGFGRDKGVAMAGIVPLAVDSSVLPQARSSGAFASDGTISLRSLPVAELRESWDSVEPEVEQVLAKMSELFATHVATPFRRHNVLELEAAVFDEVTRERLLREGLVSIPVAPDSIYGHLAAAKLHFPDWLVTDYVLSLATKPFVILSGISGTGKTKLAQAVSAFLAPDWEAEVVVAPGVESLGEGFTRVQVIPSAIKHRRLIIPTALVEGFAVPEYPEAFDFTVRADGQVFPARLYGHPTARTLQVHMKPELYSWFSNNVKTGDYIGMRLNPIEEEVPDFELEIRTLPVERRTEKRPSARVAFLSVRPDWTDNRGLLGYYNPLMREYAATELLRLLLRAQAHPDEPHFVILDEMNLAKVEYYFSDFLSAMESGTEMVLHDASEELYVNSAEGPLPVPQRLVVPQNVLFTGTVNVDETTYMFSPKVLDRANTIEFNEVSLDTYGADGSWDSGEFRLREGLDLNSILRSRKPEMEDWVALSDEYKDRLRSLHAVMENHNLHFGYRVANEVARYLLLAAECVGEEQLETAFDLQILQKVLPKLAGNRAKLYQPIRELLAWCIDPDGEGGRALAPGSAGAISLNSARYPRSAVKLRRMLETLETVGFVSFVE